MSNVEWSQNKYKINRIRNPSIQFLVRGRKRQKKKWKHQLIIIFFQHVGSHSHVMKSSCSVQPVSKYFSNNCGQWNNEEAVCSYTKFFAFPRRGPRVCFAAQVMWPNNKSKWVFIHFELEWSGMNGKEQSRSKKKILVEWLIKLDIDKYCVSWWGHPWRCRLEISFSKMFRRHLSYTFPWSLRHPLNVRSLLAFSSVSLATW